MCGRFELHSPLSEILKEFRATTALRKAQARYNIAPSQNVLVVKNAGRGPGSNEVAECRWGFIPPWAKEEKTGYSMINARAESLADKPAYRGAFRKHRCLVIADGFYEWQVRDGKKFPMLIRLRSKRPFGMAGLCSDWVPPGGDAFCTCTIVTTDANALLRSVHDRMPVIVPEEARERWLDPGMSDTAGLVSLLRPYPDGELEYHEVSTRINSPTHDSPDLIEPL